ncbi:MAG: ORF6N domain-containing protein [Ruminococcus sp.]|nr:ORF6N domain-containing protein [Ruminococcus sp.]
MSNVVENNIEIKKLIYIIREKEVMLDSDLARLYSVTTRRINESVKRNKNKFPERFAWILTDDEFMCLRSQFATANNHYNYAKNRYNPRVFTKQGVAMLATILKSDVAIEVSIAIMDAFVLMRHTMLDNNQMLSSLVNINNEIANHKKHLLVLDEKVEDLFQNSKIKKKQKCFILMVRFMMLILRFWIL